MQDESLTTLLPSDRQTVKSKLLSMADPVLHYQELSDNPEEH